MSNISTNFELPQDNERITFAQCSDVMMDLETLGQCAGCSVIQIGAVGFNPYLNKLGPDFSITINRESCRAINLQENPATLQWWDNQTEEAKMILTVSKESDITIQDALIKFAEFIRQFDNKKLGVWGCGSDFDNAILSYCYNVCEMEVPWPFWNNRCFRTLKSIHNTRAPLRKGTHHDALDDSIHQANYAIKILRRIYHYDEIP